MPLRQTYGSQLNPPLTAIVTNNTFTGPQNLIKTAAAYSSKPTTIPVGYFEDGTTFRTEAWGTFSTTGTPTLVFGVYYGATALAVNVAFTTASGAATLPWHFRVITQVISAAVPSAVVTSSHGELVYGTTVAATTQIPIPGIAQASVNVDNTAAGELSVQATFSASSASNIVVLRGFYIEEITQS